MKVLLSALALLGLVSGQTRLSGVKTNRAEIFDSPFRDVVELDHEHVVREFENEKVRILHFHLKGDALVPLHDSRSGTVVAVSETHVRFARQDHKVVDHCCPN
jgi:hypothetical protein